MNDFPLTYVQYLDFHYKELDSHCDFEKLKARAITVLDSQTSFFFSRSTSAIEGTFLGGLAQRALSAQIEYFQELGSTTLVGMNNNIRSQKVGPITVQRSSGVRSGQESYEILAPEAEMLLESSGLLYRGVRSL